MTKSFQDTRDNDLRYVAAGEVSLLRKLSGCQFVVSLYDYYEGINESCIITEYLAGTDLFDTIAHRTFTLTEDKCRVITGQVLEALSFIHDRRIVHMDIKPNNIMFANRGKENLHIKLIDFGLARELGGMGRARCGMVGTVEFMSPEVIGSSYAVPASDMWSLGVMLFMMVSGGLSPFWAGNDLRTEARVIVGDFRLDLPHFQSVTKEAKDLIAKLILLSPNCRLSALAALRHPWLVPNTEVIKLSKVIAIDTALMRRFNARRRWTKLRNVLSVLKWLKPRQDGKLDFDIEKLVVKHIKRNRLKKCFKRKKSLK